MRESMEDGSSSSKEEVERSSELTESETKALLELKQLIQDAYDKDQRRTSFEGNPTKIWGVPLLGDKRSDVIILKFLKSTNFEVLGAFAMIKNTLRWRDEVGIETLLEEDENLGNEYNNVMFIHGYDKEGYPVWYLVLEDVLNDNLSQITSSDEQKQRIFLRWLIQFAEKNIRKLDFTTNGKNSFMLVIDLKRLTWYGNRDLYKVIYKFLQVLHDNYPDFVAKQLWINVSWWYRNYCRVYSMVFELWNTNEIVVFSGQTKTMETLFRYISPAQLPVKYGGLSKDNEHDFRQSNTQDIVSEVTIKPSGTQRVEFCFVKSCNVLWELRVIGWDVIYDAKFVPDMKGSYITNISRPRKLTTSDGLIISEGFRVNEPGKLVLTVHNTSSTKKKLLTRVRVLSSGLNLEHEPSLRGWLVQSDEGE